MKRRLLAFVAALAVAASAQAAPPTDASIDELLVVTRTERLVETMLANIDQTMRLSMARAVGNRAVTPEQQRVLDAVPAKFVAVMRDEMSWPRLRAMYLEIYRDTFTQEEIDGLLAFYKSATGAAFVDKMPVVLQKSSAVMQARIGPLMEKMMAAMQQALEEAKVAK